MDAEIPAPAGLIKSPAERLADRITIAHVQDLQAKVRLPSSQPYTYLSGIHPCARHLVYLMTEGEKRPPVDLYVQGLFESGEEAEKWVKRKMLGFGYELFRAQEEVLIHYAGPVKTLTGQLIGKGKVDGICKLIDEHTDPRRGVDIPAEVKSMGEQMFKKLNTVDDLLEYAHTEKYVKQLLTYLYGKNLENGIFIITDCRGHLKAIPVLLGNHLELAEFALHTMEKAWEAKAAGVLPDRVEWHPKSCGRCDFQIICLPASTIGGAAEVIEDPELEAAIGQHESLKALTAEYDEIHETLVARFKATSQATVGRYIIVPKQRNRVSYDSKQLDDETRARIKKETPFVVLEIKEIAPEKPA